MLCRKCIEYYVSILALPYGGTQSLPSTTTTTTTTTTEKVYSLEKDDIINFTLNADLNQNFTDANATAVFLPSWTQHISIRLPLDHLNGNQVLQWIFIGTFIVSFIVNIILVAVLLKKTGQAPLALEVKASNVQDTDKNEISGDKTSCETPV